MGEFDNKRDYPVIKISHPCGRKKVSVTFFNISRLTVLREGKGSGKNNLEFSDS